MAEAHRDEITKLEALYASNPEGRVFTHLAEAYRKAGSLDRARQTLTDGMKKHPDSASAYVVLGRVLSDSGDVEGGFEAFRRALELDTGNLVALRWCGDLAMRTGRIDDALGYYHELMARDPSDDNLRERVAIIEGDRAAAMSAAPSSGDTSFGDHTSSGAPAEQDISDQTFGATDDFDPADLPGDLAAFAGRQAESRTGKSWTPDESTSETPSEDEIFADSLTFDIEASMATDEAELLDLPMETSFGMGFESAGDVPNTGSADQPSADAAATDPFAGFELAGDNVDVFAAEPDEFRPSLDQPASLEEPASLQEIDNAPTPFEEPSEFLAPTESEPANAGAANDVAANDVLPDDGTAESGAAANDTPAELEGPAEIESLLPEEDRLETLVPDAAEGYEEGGFGDAVGGPAAPPLVTETMAELYRNQGFPERAADVYRQLIRERGSDTRLEQKLAELEAEMAPSAEADDSAVGGGLVLEQDDAGEMWLKDETSPWTSSEPGGAEHASPYGWESEPEESAAGAPITSYFQSLLQWKPGNVSGASSSPDASLSPTAASAQGAVDEPPQIYASAEEDVLMLDEPSEPTPAWTPDALSAPAADEPWAAGPAVTHTSHTEPAPAPATTSAEELMPWEMGESATPAATSFAAAAPEVSGGAAAPSAPAGELMPWETAPAAELPAPEASIPAAVPPTTDDQNGGGAEGEDDEDLEMFRTWLQSLKK